MRRISVFFLILFAFAVPWEYSLDFGEPFGNVARILGTLALLFTISRVADSRRMRRPGTLQLAVLALYLYYVCSVFWSIDPVTTLSKIRSYFQVIMTVWLLWEGVEEPEELRDLLRAFVAGCWVLASLTLVNFSSAGGVWAAQVRFVAAGQDPNDVARFLDLGIPIAALLFATEKRRLIRGMSILYLPVGLLAVLLTASRGGFSASLVALLGSAILLLTWKPQTASLVFAGFALTAGALWPLVPVSSMQRLGTIPAQVISADLNDRLSIWIAGWRAFSRAPWLGYGAGTYTTASGLATGDTAHNTWMAILVTGGLAGLLMFAAVLAGVVHAIAHTKGLVRLALGTAFAVWSITAMVGSVEENRATWLLFGAMALAGRVATERGARLSLILSGGNELKPRSRRNSNGKTHSATCT